MNVHPSDPAGDSVKPPSASPPPDDPTKPLTAAEIPGLHTIPTATGDSVLEVVHEVKDDEVLPEEQPEGIHETVRTLLVGKPLNLDDKRIFSHISLIAFFAWVGLGADGLSSSCYGPAEAFLHLKGFEYLAVFLALAIVFTVLVISMCYSHIIEAFPSGGGGYLVASKMLGPNVGVISGCSLVVDYVLTVTVSIAAAGDALFGLLSVLGLDPEKFHQAKLWTETGAILILIILNLRGVKESVTVLMPIFLTFLVTHAILIVGVLAMHVGQIGTTASNISTSISKDVANPEIGLVGLLFLLLRAYSLGAGTYTGIEAVSNSMPVLREPRVATAQRTMLYMAFSLAITAGGLMMAYLLLNMKATEGGKTMNHLLSEEFAAIFPVWLQSPFVWVTMLSEAALLVVAAQAGFIDGPRCLANMAHDSWVPHWFGSLSERLATHNGILLIGSAGLAALWSTGGNVSTLVLMYAINVFLTFSLSMLGMCLHWWRLRGKDPLWRRRLVLFGFGLTMCVSILIATITLKFFAGAWKTIAVTGAFIVLCYLIRRYYRNVTKRLKSLNESLGTIEIKDAPTKAPLRPQEPTAVILVGGYSGIGVHTLLNSLRFVPHHFKNIVFISVGVVDSGNFKGAEAVEDLRQFTEDSLEKYVDLARRMGLPARAYMAIGTDVVEELEQLCRVVARDFPQSTVFAGQLVFQRETWYASLLHNQTAYSLQRRLQWDGIPMVILPTRVREPA